ncbi:MAG: hypothetical protein ACUVUR_04050 [bacterium]
MMSFIITLTIITLPATAEMPGNKISNQHVAMLASIILPGSGQLLSNAKNRGEAMLWLDGLFWAGKAGFSWFKTSREQDARLIASKYAGADITISDPRYYRALERYNNAVEYNEDVRREARELYPDNPDAQRRYYESRGYFGSSQWNWGSDSIRIYSYWQTRKAARNAKMTASFITAALVLNRLVSLLDCIFFSPKVAASQRLQINSTNGQLGLRYRL